MADTTFNWKLMYEEQEKELEDLRHRYKELDSRHNDALIKIAAHNTAELSEIKCMVCEEKDKQIDYFKDLVDYLVFTIKEIKDGE